MHKGAIILVDDDQDDKEMCEQIFEELGRDNEFIYFDNAIDAYNYLSNTYKKIFMIICDINLPGVDGLEFKQKIDNTPELRRKSIPFIFFSTWTHEEDVEKAYTEMTIQGFFKKSNNYLTVKNDLKAILDYWDKAVFPDSQM